MASKVGFSQSPLVSNRPVLDGTVLDHPAEREDGWLGDWSLSWVGLVGRLIAWSLATSMEFAFRGRLAT